MSFNSLAYLALLLLSSAITSTLAGELDVPGYDILNRARLEPLLKQEYKRAPSRTYGLSKNWQGELELLIMTACSLSAVQETTS